MLFGSYIKIVYLEKYIRLSNVPKFLVTDFTWAVELNRFGLEFVGLWPKIDKTTRNTYISDLRVCIIFIIITFVSGIPLVCSLIRVRSDITLVIDNLQVTLPLMVVSLKLVIMRWKQTGTYKIILEYFRHNNLYTICIFLIYLCCIQFCHH